MMSKEDFFLSCSANFENEPTKCQVVLYILWCLGSISMKCDF